jgi:hypothetical protein
VDDASAVGAAAMISATGSGEEGGDEGVKT